MQHTGEIKVISVLVHFTVIKKMYGSFPYHFLNVTLCRCCGLLAGILLSFPKSRLSLTSQMTEMQNARFNIKIKIQRSVEPAILKSSIG